jgi:hypothetical protein
MEKLIKDSLLNNLQVKVFGKIVSELKFELAGEKNKVLNQFGNNPVIVQIFGAKVQGICVKLNEPKILVLPNNSVDADDCGYDADTKMWVLERGFKTSSIEINEFTIDDLGDKSVLDITIKSIKYEAGRMSGKAQVEINLIVKYSQEVRFNLQVQPNDGWIPVTSFNLAGYQIEIQAKVDSTKGCLRAITPLGEVKHCKNY